MTIRSHFWAVYRRRKTIDATLFVYADGQARPTQDTVSIKNKDGTRITDSEVAGIIASGLVPTLQAYPNHLHRAGNWIGRLPADGPDVLGTVVP